MNMYICPKCGTEHNNKEWDATTKSDMIYNRKLTKQTEAEVFIPIEENEEDKKMYTCPECNFNSTYDHIIYRTYRVTGRG